MGQFIIDNGDSNNYDSYYQPVEKKPHTKKWILILALLALISLILWVTGVFKPADKDTEYQSTLDTICAQAIVYVNDTINQSKIKGINIAGKIFYITVKDLVKAELIESNITNPLTNEKIPITTDIMLKVVSKGNFLCEGLAYAADDREAPVVTLLGDAVVTVPVGGTYNDPGAVATDNRDGDIDENVTRSGNVNFSKAGTYIISYFAIDRAENFSNTVTRTIIVK